MLLFYIFQFVCKDFLLQFSNLHFSNDQVSVLSILFNVLVNHMCIVFCEMPVHRLGHFLLCFVVVYFLTELSVYSSEKRLINVSCANIVSLSGTCLFTLLAVSFDE